MKRLFQNKFFLKSIQIFSFLLPVFTFGARIANAAQCGIHSGLLCNPLESKTDSIAKSLALVILYLLSVAGIITLLFMVIAGIRYILSAGNEEKMKSAKDALSSTGIGLVLILLSYTILSVIYGILNG